MKTKPIIFSTLMVQRILEGNKSQTRRLIKPLPIIDNDSGCDSLIVNHARYQIGDILWVRETWQHTKILNLIPSDENYGYVYRADDQPWEDHEGWKWKPSIFMPKEAARIYLKVTDVRVERLQDISGGDAIKEGCIITNKPWEGWCWEIDLYSTNSPSLAFSMVWKRINGKKSWEANPWVWAIEFQKLNHDPLGNPIVKPKLKVT